jgi:hypothetical protein
MGGPDHVPHRGCRHDHADAFQFADDAHIAPARVLPRDLANQLADLPIDRWSAEAAAKRPPPDDQPTMPRE